MDPRGETQPYLEVVGDLSDVVRTEGFVHDVCDVERRVAWTIGDQRLALSFTLPRLQPFALHYRCYTDDFLIRSQAPLLVVLQSLRPETHGSPKISRPTPRTLANTKIPSVHVVHVTCRAWPIAGLEHISVEKDSYSG